MVFLNFSFFEKADFETKSPDDKNACKITQWGVASKLVSDELKGFLITKA